MSLLGFDAPALALIATAIATLVAFVMRLSAAITLRRRPLVANFYNWMRLG